LVLVRKFMQLTICRVTSLAGFVEREKLFIYKEIIVLAIENHELNGRENEVLLLGVSTYS
jgi:hypothetical protein